MYYLCSTPHLCSTSLQRSVEMLASKQILHTLAEWVIQVKRKRITNAHLALPTFEAFPVLSEPATSFSTVTSITQKDGFQFAVICIGNMQCAQRFPARPADPDSSVFAELFPAPQSAPSQPNVPTAKG